MEPKEQYCNAVWNYLRGPRKERKAFLRELREDLDSFLEQNTDAVYADIEGNFGKPEALGQEFSRTIEPQVMSAYLRLKKSFLIFVGAVVILTVAVIISLQTADYIKHENFRNGRWVETVYTGTPPPLNVPEDTIIRVYD